MNVTDEQRRAVDRLLAAQERRGLRLSDKQLSEIAPMLAARKVELFNGRFAVGAAVMYIPGVQKAPQRERVYRAARVEDGRAVVELAGVLLPVDVDQCFGLIEEPASVDRPPRRLSVLQIAAAVAAGFALAVIVALLIPSAKAVSPERIVIDCYEPGEGPDEMAQQPERRRT